MIIMIDSHCHLECMKNADEIIENSKKKLKAVVTSVCEPKDAEKGLELQERHKGFVFLCLGMHPQGLEKYTEKEIDNYTELIKQNKKKIVAIGEIGLDYYWVKNEDQRDRCKEIFSRFIELAKELKKPIVIHCREAWDDTLEILKNHNATNVMLHCFSGNENILKKSLERKYMISYATNICYTKKHSYLIAKTPLYNILLETDSPWLNPENPIEITNEPLNIIRSSEIIAKIKGIPKEEVLEIAEGNAKKFYNLKI